MGMTFQFNQRQLVAVRSGLNVMIENYRAIAEKEPNAADKQDLLAYVRRAEEMLVTFRALPTEPETVDVPLLPGPLSVVERGLRMGGARWQQMIRPTMTDEQKATHRESAAEYGAILTQLRQARGLPW